MPYDIVLNPRKAVAVFNVIDDQIPYATMKALNELATTFQDTERGVIQQDMTIRRPWVLQGVKINRGDFATKSKLSAKVRIDDQRDFLNKFEEGGTRRPTAGAEALAVPDQVRPNRSASIPNALRPKQLGFHEVGGSRLASSTKGVNKGLRSSVLRGNARVYEGNRRTVLIQNADGSGVILQRVSSRRGSVVHVHGGRFHEEGITVGRRDAGLIMLYRLSPSTRVPRDLHFRDTVSAVLPRWPSIFQKWYALAVSTAR
jgi:hypothetical protein